MKTALSLAAIMLLTFVSITIYSLWQDEKIAHDKVVAEFNTHKTDCAKLDALSTEMATRFEKCMKWQASLKESKADLEKRVSRLTLRLEEMHLKDAKDSDKAIKSLDSLEKKIKGLEEIQEELEITIKELEIVISLIGM